MATRLSVNLNKIALLRNARGGALPSVVEAARTCVEAGCHGLTLHPRPDRRHALPEDCLALRAFRSVELNLEGNPFEPPRPGYPGFLELVLETMPDQCTLVPDAGDQRTSDHGWDLPREAERLAPVLERLRAAGIRSSLFVDAGCPGLELAAAIGADRIELYTGPWAQAWAAGRPEQALAALRDSAEQARALGLGVNAGHDLDQHNLGPLLRALPQIDEVSIGHALVAEALYAGLSPTVRAYLAILASPRGG